MYSQFIWIFFWGVGSEVEKVNKVLRVEGHGATVWVVGCAGMVCVLGKETKTHNYQY